MTNWADFKKRRDYALAEYGQWVGLCDANHEPLYDIEDITAAVFPQPFFDAGSMSLTLPGRLKTGEPNPVIRRLMSTDLDKITAPGIDALLHEALYIVVERPGAPRRAYRIMGISTSGGRDVPEKQVITGVSLLEHLKHIPLWADPSNRSKVVQLQFADVQQGTAEDVSKKLAVRNLLGYFQPSLLANMFSWTEDWWAVTHWRNIIPDLHPIMCSPVRSNIPNEWCVVEARWDSMWDLLQPTWKAAGIMPSADLWWPGDPQPWPDHTTLAKPTVLLDFKPRALWSGATGLVGQGIRGIKRRIAEDNFTSIVELDDAPIPTRNGTPPWVVFEFPEAPTIHVKKSSDWRVIVGGQSPRSINVLIETGIKSAFAAFVTQAIPFIGPAASALVQASGEMLASLTADRFLNLSELSDQNRKAYHGRGAYVSLTKTGQGNSLDALQKAWQAKTETDGSIGIEFDIDDPYPYTPGVHFDRGDVVGVKAWGIIWAAYIASIDWTITPQQPIGWKLALGDLNLLTDPEALLQANWEQTKAVIGRIATVVTA